MTYDQYSQYPLQQQSRPHYNQAPTSRGGTRGGFAPRGQDPYRHAYDGHGQQRQRPNDRIESYAGYDGDIFDSYGADNSNYNSGGYDQHYQHDGYGQAGHNGYGAHQGHPQPQHHHEPYQQRRDEYGTSRGNMMHMQGGGRGRPPPSRDYPPMQDRPLRSQEFPPQQDSFSPQHEYPQQDYPSSQGYPPQQNYGPPPRNFQDHDARRQLHHPQQPYDDRQQSSRAQRSPPQQKPRERLLQPTSPKTMPFDNPFPVFPAGQQTKPKNGVASVEHAMAGMDLDGRPSYDSQRPQTSHSQKSQHSTKQNFPTQRMDPNYGPSQSYQPENGYNHRPSLDHHNPLGPPQRAMTMPQDMGQPQFRGNGHRQGQSQNRHPNQSHDAHGYPRTFQGPESQQSFPAFGDRPGMMQAPPRPSTATGMRQPMQVDNDFNYRSPPNNFGPPRPGTSHEHRDRRGPPPMGREPQPGSYMQDFNPRPRQQRPPQGPVGVELDGTPVSDRPSISAQPPQPPQHSTDFRSARSQPDLRGQANGYGSNGYNDFDPKMPRYDAGALSGQRRSPPRALVTDSSQMPRLNQTRSSELTSPRQFHRPGAPPLNRQGTAESGRSDPGTAMVRGASIDEQTSAQSSRPANPDALPAHPTPVRPGLSATRPGAASIRQEQAERMSGTPGDSAKPPAEEPITVQELARLRDGVKAKPGDQAQQLHLAKKLVEAAQVLANDGGRADAKQTLKNRENYIHEAHKIVKKLVSASYLEAMFYLADCHGTGGLGLNPDPREAFGLYQSAAKMGHGPSAYRTAVCCEMGQSNGGGTREDPQKAVQWYRRAAALGDVPAMYKLGMIMLKGHLGQQVNLGEAMIWLQRAAAKSDLDNPHALHELGGLYESVPDGAQILRDEKLAIDLYTKAAKLGYKNSQCRLAKAYEYGELGLPIDNRNSIHWYSKAAAQEEHDAELALSGWYLTGSPGILEQNDQEAYLWARKAALAENPKAEFAMGYFSETGIGCPKSFEDAKRWYGRAAAHRYPKARERLEELMRGGSKGMKSKERISRSDPKKHEDCSIM